MFSNIFSVIKGEVEDLTVVAVGFDIKNVPKKDQFFKIKDHFFPKIKMKYIGIAKNGDDEITSNIVYFIEDGATKCSKTRLINFKEYAIIGIMNNKIVNNECEIVYLKDKQ